MKVLILLDDIDHGDHLEYLAGDLGWFAMQLFNKHAFKNEVPDEHFKKFSLEVVNHAKGLPLALKHLPSLRKLNLSYSERLMQTPDFTGMPNLEYLDLSNCSNLEEVTRSLDV
ncbi:hypothetical protein MTR67_001311 [Solanum verrucosum]|uniref:LRR-RLK n=1 Tax=Solanum verrucosum TaxID=315347 RepID=A0AAF0T7D9_SOLVR|nr:hypothetical protein MTR67_001311 [Solanum verrucosum]